MMAFACLVFGNLGLILTNRYRTRSIWATLRVPNPALWWVVGGTVVFLALVIGVPFLSNLFEFAPMHSWEMALIAVTASVSILISESMKWKPLQKLIHRGR